MEKLKYRPEIDGLRAISVVGVILFHAGLGFPGGFVGVDVFFVISGFLITSIIYYELEKDEFLISKFWVRRIRRILPAAFATTIAVLAFAFFWVDSNTLVDIGWASASQSVMLANVYFWKDAGYFSAAAETKPLLHMWSLAVEEQFYLFFPMLFSLVFRLSKTYVPLIFIGLFFLSLTLNLVAIGLYPSATFFLLPTRAWELFAGAIVAIFFHRFSWSVVVSEFLAIAGLAMILVAMLCYDKSTPFPGFAALLPVTGTAVFISSTAISSQSLGARLLKTPFLVYLGKISYSWYLVHWPILVFANLAVFDYRERVGLRILLVVGSLFLAHLSWKLVESPFRRKGFLVEKRKAYPFGIALSMTMLIASVFMICTNGLASRFTEHEIALTADIHWNGTKYADRKRIPNGIRIGSSEASDDLFQNVDFVLWGDSHGMVCAKLLDEMAKTRKLKGVAFLEPGMAPITNLWKPAKGPDRRSLATDRNNHILETILRSKIKNLILVGRWSAMCNGRSAVEMQDQPERPANFPMVANQDFDGLTNGQSSMAFKASLTDMIQRLGQNGVKVWILKQVPEVPNANVARQFYLANKFPWWNVFPDCSGTYQQHLKRQNSSNTIINGLRSDLTKVLDPSSQFFDSQGGSTFEVFEDRAFYRDDDHLTQHGAEVFLTPIFAKVFDEFELVHD